MIEEEAPSPPRRKPIPREAWRQEKAVALARTVIVGDYDFIAHDRSQARGDKSHMWQWKRGVRKALPDTQTIFPVKIISAVSIVCTVGRHAWFEFKAKGQAPDADQILMLERLRSFGDFASWGVMLEDLVNFWMECGVPLVANAHVMALQYDGLVDSRIARAEAAAPRKKPASRKAGPRSTFSVAQARRAGVWK